MAEENKLLTKINSQKVSINPIDQDLNGELADKIYYQCDFCEKHIGLYRNFRRICERLSGDGFYCPFCLRHGFNTKNNKNILILSFQSIIGYLYYEKYIFSYTRGIWLSELNEILRVHAETGLQNPAFSYDSESGLWFIDFSKVGRGKKKIKLKDVIKTVANILLCFNLSHNIPMLKTSKFFAKYISAINKFYTNRYRPEDKRILIPTFSNCGIYDANKKFTLEDTRVFTPKKLIATDKNLF